MKSVGGGPSKFRIGFGGGGSCKFRIRGEKPVTLHFQIIIYLLNYQINYLIYSIQYFSVSVSVQYLTGTPFRYCVKGGGVKGEVASGSAPPSWGCSWSCRGGSSHLLWFVGSNCAYILCVCGEVRENALWNRGQ